MGIYKSLILIGAVVAGVASAVIGQELTKDVTTNPDSAKFVFTDVENFDLALKQLSGNPDTLAILTEHYFEKSTPGLKMFIEKYNLTPERIQKAMREHPEKYSEIGQTLGLLRSQEPRFRKSYGKMKKVFSGAVFPPTYFLVAGYRGIGSGSIEGPLISIEKESKESIEGDLAATLVHEMTHMQQLALVGGRYFEIFSGEKRTLLALSIREGVATYLAELIEGGSEHKNAARDYLLEHEQELWEKFRTQMTGGETGDWLWREPENPEQPQDVGYAIGARIAETFYNKANDKQAAARELLSITEYEEFLKRSGYGENWK